MNEPRDEHGNLRCHVPGCKTVISGVTGLYELTKFMRHMWLAHDVHMDMNEAIENRVLIEMCGPEHSSDDCPDFHNHNLH